MQGVGHEVAMSYFVFLASTPNCKRFNNCKSPLFHEQDRPFATFEIIATEGRNLKTALRPLGWQRKIALSKIGEPKVGPSSWRPQRGVIHTKPKVGPSGQ